MSKKQRNSVISAITEMVEEINSKIVALKDSRRGILSECEALSSRVFADGEALFGLFLQGEFDHLIDSMSIVINDVHIGVNSRAAAFDTLCRFIAGGYTASIYVGTVFGKQIVLGASMSQMFRPNLRSGLNYLVDNKHYPKAKVAGRSKPRSIAIHGTKPVNDETFPLYAALVWGICNVPSSGSIFGYAYPVPSANIPEMHLHVSCTVIKLDILNMGENEPKKAGESGSDDDDNIDSDED